MMSKVLNRIFALVTLSLFMVVSGFADTGCKTGKFVGSYTTMRTSSDVWGDGSGVRHAFVYQLNLTSDGTAYEQFTGLPDLMLSEGTSTPAIGSWQCRQDGQLVVNLISTVYLPTKDAALHGFANVPTDLLLFLNVRTTYLFSVTDDNSLTRIQARNRRYAPTEDPTNPQAGTLGALDISSVIYQRLIASDADLLAP
jgi:hypothetical protein